MRKSSGPSLPSLSIRLDLDADCRIGPGKIQLLEQIHACGSISAAGRAMQMPYKRAWHLVDEINRICRRGAVERLVGGKNGGGAIPHAVWPFSRRPLPEKSNAPLSTRPARTFCFAGGLGCSNKGLNGRHGESPLGSDTSCPAALSW
jgi:hypothetical protein